MVNKRQTDYVDGHSSKHFLVAKQLYESLHIAKLSSASVNFNFNFKLEAEIVLFSISPTRPPARQAGRPE